HSLDVPYRQSDARARRYKIIRRNRKNRATLYGAQEWVLLPKLLHSSFLTLGDHLAVTHINDYVRISPDHLFHVDLWIRNGRLGENILGTGQGNQLAQITPTTNSNQIRDATRGTADHEQHFRFAPAALLGRHLAKLCLDRLDQRLTAAALADFIGDHANGIVNTCKILRLEF